MTWISNRYKLLLILIGSALFLSLATLSYAFFTSSYIGTNQTVGSLSGTLKLTYTDCVTDSSSASCEDISASLSPGDSVVKTFQIKNTGSLGTTYDLYFTEIYNTFTNDELVYTITNIDTGEVLALETAVTYSETVSLNETIKENISIEGGETQRYRLTVTFLNTDYDQSDNENAEFKLKLGLLEKTYETLEITDIALKDSSDASGSITSSSGTTMGSTVSLSTTDGTSTISYYVTLYNATDYTYTYVGIDTANSCFDNDYITYTVNGLSYGDQIEPNTGTMFSITFSYTDDTVASNISLTSSIHFEFARAYKISYSGIYDTSSLPTLYYIDTDPSEQTIDLGSLDIDDVIIYQGSTKLTGGGYHYTFADGILTFVNISGDITITGLSNYCTTNGITSLGDCIIAMDQNTTDVESAKLSIQNKGTPDFTVTEPVIEYEATMTSLTGTSIASTSSTSIYYGTSYTFNTSTGNYVLSGTSYVSPGEVITTDTSDIHYTCFSTSTSCTTMYVVYGIRSTTSTANVTTYYVTSADRYTFAIGGTSTSNPGLYYSIDDYGNTYYYRGLVTNNYVSFAGFIWRIVRINGDGSVRLIYSGTTTSATSTAAQIGTSQFNSSYNDPAYVGYTYKADYNYIETSSVIAYSNIGAGKTYTFYDSYSCDDDANLCTPSGNSVSGTWSSIYSAYATSYPYTCWALGSTCKIMSVLQGYNSTTNAKVTYIGYISSDVNNITNGIENGGTDTDSTIKTNIDKWYISNIYGTDYQDYLSDTLFCNDRSYYSGNSTFLLTTHTYFGAYGRNALKKTPSFVCPNQEDEYTVSVDQENNIGNGNLTYPIGLLTIDEASFAGGKNGSMNQLFYLYTGSYYWTMSSFYFFVNYLYAYVWSVYSTGNLYGSWAATSIGVRPVINLNSKVLIIDGNGTADSPFELELNNA